MKFLIGIITSAILSINTPTETIPPIPIDAFIQAYDAMYNSPEDFKKDYIILDMVSN